MNFIKSALSLIMCLVFIAGCAPAGPYSEPGPDYYADMERSNIDGRWYHKNPPSRDMMSYDSPRRED